MIETLHRQQIIVTRSLIALVSAGALALLLSGSLSSNQQSPQKAGTCLSRK
jgi:hypothetical protein